MAQTALHNTTQTGTFIERRDDGYAFELRDLGGDGEEDTSMAVIDQGEYEGEADFEEGETVELLVEQFDETRQAWRASARKLEKLEKWEWIKECVQSQKVVEGDILKTNKGGLSVDIGVRAFLPRSQVGLHEVNDLESLVGTSGGFVVIKFDEDRCNVVVSRKKVLEQQRAEQREETIEEIEEGETFEGIVRNIQDYGAFVDIGGVDGLLHISNISWDRLDHPKQALSVGDKIEVQVLEWKPDDDRLSLGRKQLMENPWENIEQKYPEGEEVSGDIVSLADFGAFVELEPGVQGLVHVTEISWTNQISHPGQVLNVGDEVDVKVVSLEPEKERIGLSIKQLVPNPWEELRENYQEGDVISGEIRNITDFGLFVEVTDEIQGLVHVSDISWTEQIQDPADYYEEGDEIEVQILDIDIDKKRVGLGVKQLEDRPWDSALERAEVGEKIEVEVTKLTDFGAFAEVVDGVEGLIHISELTERRIQSPREAVRPGETVEALVLDVDEDRERISLSLKRDELEEAGPSEFTEDEDAAVKLGDVIADQLDAERGEQAAEEADEDETTDEQQ